MGLVEIGASIAAALLVGALTRGAWRTYLLLGLSTIAVYWFQPALPLRSFDFWLPSLTLALVILTWFITSQPGVWREPFNLTALFIIGGFVTLIDLSRYILPDPIITTSSPPQFAQYLFFTIILAIVIWLFLWLSHRQTWILSVAIILLIAILVVLKTPALSLQTSILLRNLTGRSVENALANDLRWLGFSYIAFRLIHVLRDRQLQRLPELSLAEFGTYVAFFPTLAAGPIDRAERFAQDLRKEFTLTQEETLLAGQRL